MAVMFFNVPSPKKLDMKVSDILDKTLKDGDHMPLKAWHNNGNLYQCGSQNPLQEQTMLKRSTTNSMVKNKPHEP